jgi:glycosyltransferase involved in cell wall biosynthesis
VLAINGFRSAMFEVDKQLSGETIERSKDSLVINNGRLPIIAMDTWILSRRYQNHGVHVYARQLLKYFQDAAAQNSIIFKPFVCSGSDNLANRLDFCEHVEPSESPLLRHDRLWRMGGASYTAVRGHQDVIFSPHYHTMYIGELTPAVITIHDVTPRLVPMDTWKVTALLRLFIWWSARYSRSIITVSNHSKNDIVQFYGVPESKISVIYQGYDKRRFNNLPFDPGALADMRAKFGLTRPYILHHGVDKPNKNLGRLVEAYRRMQLRNRNLDVDLVLAGPTGATLRNQVGSGEGSGRGKVILTQAIGDDDLALLVRGAELAVFPSLYEGFCLPMVEAMACGVPTICSNASCLPEISGGVLRYFDPLSVEDMACCLEAAMEDTMLRAEISLKGQKRAEEFDWSKCARETLAVLKQEATRSEKTFAAAG